MRDSETENTAAKDTASVKKILLLYSTGNDTALQDLVSTSCKPVFILRKQVFGFVEACGG